jgi:hypothetical protein
MAREIDSIALSKENPTQIKQTPQISKTQINKMRLSSRSD